MEPRFRAAHLPSLLVLVESGSVVQRERQLRVGRRGALWCSAESDLSRGATRGLGGRAQLKDPGRETVMECPHGAIGRYCVSPIFFGRSGSRRRARAPDGAGTTP